jgi:hypothetical protein
MNWQRLIICLLGFCVGISLQPNGWRNTWNRTCRWFGKSSKENA